MTRDIIELRNYIVLIEQSMSHETVIDTCGLGVQAVGFAFYGSGDVQIRIAGEPGRLLYQNAKGAAISFYANEQIKFTHTVSPDRPMQCVAIFSRTQDIMDLPKEEREIFDQHMYHLLAPKDDFVEGPGFYMSPAMMDAVAKIYNNGYQGATRMMFLKSQVTELLAHFFGRLAESNDEALKLEDQSKLYEAKEILDQHIEKPPTLTELSKMIGLNDYKLKKSFKQLFGMPVFKYLQNERLTKAHDMLRTTDTTIQEAAWAVGYESLGSFSNAFQKHFGFRPSDIRH